MRFLEVIRSLDWVLLACALLLVLTGLAMLISSTYTQGFISPLFIRQAIAALVALTIFTIIVKTPYHNWRRYALFIYGAALTTLVVVALTGTVIRGTVSRLEIMGVQIQPSEFMKVALVVVLAWLLARYKMIGWKQVGLTAALAAVPVTIVLVEPDFGMAALMLAAWVGLLVFIGMPWRIFIVLALLGGILSVGAWQWLLFDYQKERIMTFLDPTSDPLSSGYNVTQSIIALGSGQLLGRGLGHGPQSQLKFLPERHTDFIFASIGEELGFVGIILILSLYAVMLWRLLRIARSTQDSFGQLVCVGVFLLFLGGFAVSAGMNMGLLPVTGIPLPLVSYGGSNLLASFILLGIAQSVHVHSHFLRVAPAEISGFV